MPQASTCAAVGLLGLLFTPCHAVSEYGEYRLSPFGWSHQGEWWLRNSAKLVRPGPTRLPALPLRRETTDCIHHVPSNTVVKETRLGTLELTFPNGTVASHAACPHARHASHLSIGQAVANETSSSWDGWPEHMWYGTDLASWDTPSIDGVVDFFESSYTIPSKPTNTGKDASRCATLFQKIYIRIKPHGLSTLHLWPHTSTTTTTAAAAITTTTTTVPHTPRTQRGQPGEPVAVVTNP
jgi:hypothetical protein